MKHLFVFILILFPFLFSACSDNSADGSSDSDSGEIHTLNFTLYSSENNMTVGSGVIYLFAKCLDGSTCSSLVTPFHVYEGVVETEGQVDISFSHAFQGDFWVSIYIDADGSNTLTSGDLVWGTDPDKIFGTKTTFPESKTSTTMPFTWESIANSNFGGFSVYAGTSKEW
jgi:hypothetical protein